MRVCMSFYKRWKYQQQKSVHTSVCVSVCVCCLFLFCIWNSLYIRNGMNWLCICLCLLKTHSQKVIQIKGGKVHAPIQIQCEKRSKNSIIFTKSKENDENANRYHWHVSQIIWKHKLLKRRIYTYIYCMAMSQYKWNISNVSFVWFLVCIFLQGYVVYANAFNSAHTLPIYCYVEINKHLSIQYILSGKSFHLYTILLLLSITWQIETCQLW